MFEGTRSHIAATATSSTRFFMVSSKAQKWGGNWRKLIREQ
jgi:hypothetical protein